MKNINKQLMTVLFAGMASISTTVIAQNSTGTGPNPYRDCGIGAALFPNVTWAAVSSNVIWDVGTTAVISATASPETCQNKNTQAAAFIFETYDSLAEETARGEGEHLATLLNILGVEAGNRTEVVTQLRNQMASIVGDVSYTSYDQLEKAESYYMAVMAAI